MRNFKKVLALVLALSLVLSMGTVSFAAETSEADVLYDLGLFKGYSATEKLLGLADEADSEQAIVLIGRALGWEVDMAATVAFEDVSEWAVPYVAYAVANNITNGVSATEFGKMVDGKRMVTWVLRALGKGLAESWDNTDALAAEMGLTVPMSATTTRGVVAGVIYDLLDATPVGGSQTVIEALVDGDAALTAIAIAAGLVDADFAVVSAESFGLTSIMVTFTSDIDTLTINSEDAAGAVAVVIEDNVAYLMLSVTEAQNSEVTIEFDALGDDEVEITEEEIVVVMADKEDPELVSVVATNPKTIDVTYSEPIEIITLGTKVFDDVMIDSAKLVGTATISANRTVVTYDLNTALAANTYIFTSEEATDYAGFVAAAEATVLTIVGDDAAPVLVSAEATSTTVIELTFDEDVATIEAAVIGNKAVVSTVADGTEVVVVTLNAGTPLVASDAFVAVACEYSAAKDVLDNESADDIEFTVLAPMDDVAPTATVSVLEDNYILVTFSEDVTGLEADGAYTLTDDDDDDADVFAGVEADLSQSSEFDADDNDATQILIEANVLDLNEGNYTLTIGADDIVDGSVLENIVAEVEFSITMLDIKSPTATDPVSVIDTDMARLTFDEAMDTAELADLANYLLNGNPLATFDDAAVTVAADGMSVDITALGLDAADTITPFGLTDVAGNTMENPGVAIDVDPAAAFTLSTATLTAVDTIVVKANKDFSIAAENEFKIYENGVISDTRYVTSAIVEDDEATLTLNSDISPDGTVLIGGVAVAVTVVIDATNYTVEDTVDDFGTVVSDVVLTLVDEVAPTVEITSTVAGELTITFDEVIDATDEATFLADLLIRDDEDALVTIVVGAATADADDVYTDFTVVTITGLVAGDTYTVQILSRNLVDTAGVANTFAGLAATEQEIFE